MSEEKDLNLEPNEEKLEEVSNEQVENKVEVNEEKVEANEAISAEVNDSNNEEASSEETKRKSELGEPKWYVVHTYSGYENKVKTDLEKTIKNRELEDYFYSVVVPMEEQVEIKDGKRKTSLKKVFPGYVLIKMIVTEGTWYIVRNTRGVTGFVGSGTNPIPLTEQEIRNMGFEELPVNVDYKVNDTVQVVNGPLEGFIGTVLEINQEKQKVKVLVSMFGRETPAELEFSQVQKTN